MMMFRTAAAAAILCAATAPAAAQSPVARAATTPAPASQWRAVSHAMGTAYETGSFDRPIDGGLRIACTSDGGATLTTQIKGVAPTVGSRFLVIPATRHGASRAPIFTFAANADGAMAFKSARNDAVFGRLWAALRGGNNATVRYADGTFAVLSLSGTRDTLPARPCGAGA